MELATPKLANPRQLAWWEPGEPGPRPARWEICAWALLLVWLWVSRLTVAPDVLFEWDSVNYALGMAEFDVYDHQPHPPGYPLYTLLLRGLGLLTSTETGPFLLANGLFGSATLLMLAWIIRRNVGPLLTLVTAAAFSVCPQFWHQGAVSSAYLAECFCSVGCMAVALALMRGRLGPAPAALLASFLLGFRPSGALSFMPLLLLSLGTCWPGWRGFASAAGAFSVGCALWFFPLVAFGGGWESYWEATSALYAWQRNTAAAVSPLYNGGVLLRFLVDGMNLLLAALLLNLVLAAALARGHGWRRTCALFGAWFLPGAAVYTFYHLAKSGYVLTLMPISFAALSLALGAALPHLRRPWRKAVLAANGLVLVIYLGLNTAAFYLAVPEELYRHPDPLIPVPDPVLLLGDYGRHGLRYQTHPQQRVKEILSGMDPRKDLSIFLFGAHELHRIAMYHHPDHRLIATSLGHRLALAAPPTAQWPGGFGDFQTEVLKPMEYEPTPPRATCIHAIYDRLVLGRGEGELSFWLGRSMVPRRLVIFYTAPASRIMTGLGIGQVRRHRVGGGFYALELKTPGLGGTLEIIDNSPQTRRLACKRIDGTGNADGVH